MINLIYHMGHILQRIFKIISLLEISSKNIFLKTFTSEFQAIEVWFTDQNSQPLEIEDRINLTVVIE